MSEKSAARQYADLVNEKIRHLFAAQKDGMETAARWIFESLSRGGVWHLFGSGHSHMAVEEAFHRAGGLVPVNPWLEDYLMPHAGPSRNGPLERMPGLAKVILDVYKPQAGEVLTVISNSGINPTSVEIAELARQAGVKTVAITNLEHSKATASRHGSGKKLFEVCELVIDTGGVKGDAALALPHFDVSVGPMSGILSLAVVNALVVQVCESYSKQGKSAPVYLSANLPGGDERNRQLETQYRARIPRLN